ncbi:MAG: ABC transporter ATP-binding protein [Alteromonadaceae bacterium]|jgi:putative ABC transport system ATP-binding protein|uniref:ABC transporter ATP-binding protein n=1 Tax=Paraglaciecola mesophila TaxID=197222 RepID=A0ABU9SZR6_9ALTE|nr:ABC transporter ATP-binding protein [Alteromonadaceae bacterium]MBB20556.1 ABC transporter ATP-binding protein [Rickettsiales bacterium]
MSSKNIDLVNLRQTLFALLKPERSFFAVVIAYSVVIGLLTLAVPIAVQTLINTIANIASTRAVATLAIVLFSTLLLSGCFAALRMRVMEYYERRIYARLVAELSMRTILAPHSYFEGSQNTSITHRYFDIMTLQKNVPSLMVDGIALILQMIVGFTLVSFYHPFLLAFNLCVILIMYIIWRLWSTQAKISAVRLSESKYSTAKWLSNLASANDFLKSSSQFDYAGKKTERYVSEYVDNHSRHFTFTFKQVVMFLVLYALASSALLGLGGWLVISGQLSIGQLVAAELIMAAVFVGLSRFSHYLKLYYELYGTADKIGGAINIPQEALEQTSKPAPAGGTLEFNKVIIKRKNESCLIDKKIVQGDKYFVSTQTNWTQRTIVNLLKRYEDPSSGWINLDNSDLSDYDTYDLRQAVFVLDRSLIIECTIEEYIHMCVPGVSTSEINNIIEKVGLTDVINSLPLKLKTPISSVGTPLQPLEFILLKLVVVMLSKPKVLVINQHFDAIPTIRRERILGVIQNTDLTVLYFSNAPTTAFFDGIIELESKKESPVDTASNQEVGHE